MKKIVLSAIILANTNIFAAVYDVIPSDYEAAKPGIQVMSINYINRTLIGPYSSGDIQTKDSISQNVYFLRYSYTDELFQNPISYNIALPFTTLETKGEILPNAIGEKAKGMNDTVLSSTYWFKADRKNKDYLALTFILAIPTGEYKETQILNIGENRYKYSLNLGYMTKLTDNTILELSPEFTVYDENEHTKMQQAPSYAINSNLRYKINKNYEVFTGYQYSYNSKTTIDSIEQNNDFFSNKYSLGAFYYTDKYNQFMFKYTKETSKEFGFKIDNEFMIRYRWWF